jgi:hypothetical protein
MEHSGLRHAGGLGHSALVAQQRDRAASGRVDVDQLSESRRRVTDAGRSEDYVLGAPLSTKVRGALECSRPRAGTRAGAAGVGRASAAAAPDRRGARLAVLEPRRRDGHLSARLARDPDRLAAAHDQPGRGQVAVPVPRAARRAPHDLRCGRANDRDMPPENPWRSPRPALARFRSRAAAHSALRHAAAAPGADAAPPAARPLQARALVVIKNDCLLAV